MDLTLAPRKSAQGWTTQMVAPRAPVPNRYVNRGAAAIPITAATPIRGLITLEIRIVHAGPCPGLIKTPCPASAAYDPGSSCELTHGVAQLATGRQRCRVPPVRDHRFVTS